RPARSRAPAAAPVAAQPPASAPPAPAPVRQEPVFPYARPMFVPRNATGMYAVGDTVAWTAHLPADIALAPGGYTYKIRKNNQDVLETGVLDFRGGRATI